MPQAILILELCLKYGPEFAKLAQQLVTKKEPTQEDWNSLWAIASKSYDQLREEARARANL